MKDDKELERFIGVTQKDEFVKVVTKHA